VKPNQRLFQFSHAKAVYVTFDIPAMAAE
jgi:hypothetical protein